jgi:hypothetical protein
MSDAVDLPSNVALEVNVRDNSVALRWTYASTEAAVEGFKALKARAETGGLIINLDDIKSRK